MMTDAEQLRTILEEELSLHQQMLPLLQEEKETILHRKPRELTQVLKKKEAVITALKKKEQSRQALIIQIAHALRTDSGKLTLRVLAATWRDQRLLALQQEFSSLLDTIKARQDENNQLIQKGSQLIQECVNILFTGPQDQCYGPQGVMKGDKQEKGYLDKKI